MKILLGCGYYLPASIGGTEMYVHSLARGLIQKGYEVAVVAPAQNDYTADHDYDGYKVFRLPVESTPSRAIIKGEKPSANIPSFKQLLDSFNPDIFHLHSLTTPLNQFHLTEAKLKGIKTIFTSHVPETTCIRGTLLYLGEKVCDGFVDTRRCLKCYLQKKGIAENSFSSVILTALKGLSIISTDVALRKKQQLELLSQSADQVIVVCRWMYDVFILNGFSPDKLTLCRQGADGQFLSRVQPDKKHNSSVHLGFIGRITPVKGLHLLLDALREFSSDTYRFTVISAGMTKGEEEYYAKQKKRVGQMPNAVWLEDVTRTEIKTMMNQFDWLAVPSLCLETGPLVVYEAMASGVPVLGSNLGGISELVQTGYSGLVFNPFDKSDLRGKLYQIIHDKFFITVQNKEMRTVDQVLDEMIGVYQSL